MKFSAWLVSAWLLAAGVCLVAQTPAPTAMQLVVTVLPKHGEAVPAVAATQVQVQQGHDHDAVVGWQRGSAADLDLAFLIDDDANHVADRLQDIKTFITALPEGATVGLFYLHTGAVAIEHNFSTDHAAVAAKLRPPTGTADVSPSPYSSLRALLQHWPVQPGRRHEMIVLSDGQEHIGGNNENNRAVEQALAAAVQAGAVVYTIYVTGASTPDATGAKVDSSASGYGSAVPAEVGRPLGGVGGPTMGNLGSSPLPMVDTSNGIVNLSELSKATGGESYAQGSATPTRFQPFLDDILQRIQSQYQLQFTPAAARQAGLNPIKIQIKENSGAKVIAPEQIFLARP